MTGQELLNALKNMSADELEKKIVFAYEYGDRANSIVTEEVAYVNIVFQEPSAYHNGHRIPDEIDGEDRELESVIVLHATSIEQDGSMYW